MTRTYSLVAGLVLLIAAGASPAQAVLSANGIHLNALTLNALTLNALTLNALTLNSLTLNALTLNALTLNALSFNGHTMAGDRQQGLAELARQPIGARDPNRGVDRSSPQDPAVFLEDVGANRQPPVKE